MKHRTLAAGLDVSAIGIGCMPMIRGGNISYGQADDDTSTRTLHEAIDLGVTFFDTAEMYGPFANEELVSQAIKGKRAARDPGASDPAGRPGHKPPLRGLRVVQEAPT